MAATGPGGAEARLMSPSRPSLRRIILPALLAVTLVAETVPLAAAVDVPRPVARPALDHGDADLQVPAPAGRSAARVEVGRDRPDLRPVLTLGRPVQLVAERATGPVDGSPAALAIRTPKPVAKVESPRAATAASGASPTTRSTSAGSYRGRNHVWIPALGIDRSISWYACSNKTYPGDRVYRWGCAGRNNVYLFGHAHSVFKPLHDAYVRKTLRKGMKVIYADDSGTVRTYTVSWWKVTTPDNGAFAFAAQSSPSMTLQTCVGSRSQYRLIVRLALAG